MNIILSELYIMESSTPHIKQYIGLSIYTKFDRIMPYLLQIFTAPSSPQVANELPSKLQRIAII